MADKKRNMLIAALSQKKADKDKAMYNISSLLDGEFERFEDVDNIGLLLKEFDNVVKCELMIDAIQGYCALHLPLKPSETKDKEGEKL